jgi:hypothetical protein
MRKIGLLSLTLVLVLGAIGVGYSHWTDTITVEGTVCTGSVDLRVIETSSTMIYKVPGGDPEIAIVHQRVNERGGDGLTWSVINVPPIPPAPAFLVASATSTLVEDDFVYIQFENAFPCAALTADFIVHYEGSVPAIVNAQITDVFDLTPDNQLNDCEMLAPYATFHFYYWDEQNGIGEEITGPVQLHYCDYVYCVMGLELPQDNSLMNLCCGFSAEITAIQWNECPGAVA